MANLRLVSVSVLGSNAISATFSNSLNENINISNVQINSQTPGVLAPAIISVSVVDNILNITTQPLTPLASYFIIFASSSSQPFSSLNGDAFILNDGITNRQLIIAPLDDTNPVQEYFLNFLRDNVYNLDTSSNVYKYLQSLSTVLSKSLYDIRQAKNENYLSFTVKDEAKTRGNGAFDRLNEEGAYEVLRVGKNLTNAQVSSTIQIPSFPDYPVSLLSTNNIESLTVNSIDKIGEFNINTFTLNVSKRFIIILNSITFIYNSVLAPYVYNIAQFGYQILNSKYDPNFAFTYLQLADNQIRINEKILNDPLFSTENISSIQVSYQYKDTGKIIDAATLKVDTAIPSGREVVPPIENIFTLLHAPIITSADVVGSVGTIVFVDPNALPGSNTPHPAFLYEIPFRFDYLPARPGEFSVDYNTGNVYVFGATNTRDGTGPFPPLAVYLYRFTFKSEIDYVYDSEASDLVALPNGSLINSAININFNFEEVLAQGVDYNSDVHIEVLDERIQNRLVALNAIQPLNFPITNVFRIFNETSGEIYKVIRWTNNKIFFNFVKAPNIVTEVGERASFQDILNELLFVNATNVVGTNNIFKILLRNNNIISQSEDEIGSSFNTSVFFSNTNIFTQEVYFDNLLTEVQNNARLLNVGQYQIDYINGIVWCFVAPTQNFSIGSVSYKRGYIAPQHPHIITVDDIYYQSSVLSQKTKIFKYTNFSDGNILPSSFDVANEGFLMGNSSLPYQIHNGQIGAFINGVFTNGVSNNIKFIRGLFEHQDLLNNTSPINFAPVSIANGITIGVNSLQFQEYHTIQFNNTDNFYILANTNLLYQSPSITFSVQIKRLSDNAVLSGNVVLGAPFKISHLTGALLNVGDPILLTYSYTIVDLSRIIVDYNKGDYFIDYSYLADEIIISYEYGDNVLDFRQSNALSPGDTYYVTYKAGALRSALLANFGTLVNIPILNSLDVSFDRERYRDALTAAMQSFLLGPTVASISNVVNTIVHTPPEIIESAFTNWSIGASLLNPESIKTTGSFALVPAKYDNGVVIDTTGQTLKFPVISNLRLEQGSLECWVIPEWDGIDNQADITFTITKNGIPLLPQQIFVGPGAFHPIFNVNTNSFTLNTKGRVLGIPNTSKDGVFIYYTADASGAFNKWYLNIFDGYADGYDDGYIDGYFDGYDDGYAGDGYISYSVIIDTNGKFYNVKPLTNPQPSTDKISSGTNRITYTITNASQINQGITFIADIQHFIFDFGKDLNSNRFSIFKDESGYLNFRVIDKFKNNYLVSADVSNWDAGEQHHIATSWALNTKNARDELHLFIDGFEVPNIIKYGEKVAPFLHEKFRTVNPEEIIGVINAAIVASTDLITTIGSTIVSSSINFSASGIIPGGIIYIEEPGFSSSGYTILNVNGQTLTLSVPMPLTTTNSAFSVNKTTFTVATEIDLYANIAVSLLHTTINATDLKTTINSPSIVATATNFANLGVLPGYVIRIVEPGFASHYNILSVSGMTLVLDDNMPVSFTNALYYIYPNVEQEIPGVRALRPAYSISRTSVNHYQGFDSVNLTIRDKAQQNDIVLIRTLGLNNKLIEKKFYLWNGMNNATVINTIMTKLPPPILLSDVMITHILLDGYLIGPSNANLFGGVFTSGQILTDQPSISSSGRTLAVNISGSNVDYSIPTTVIINGTVNGVPGVNTTLTFTANGIQNTSVKFSAVNYIMVSCKPIDPTKNCLAVYVREAFPITEPENSTIVPIIRYSYQILAGNTLSGSNSTVSDPNNFFSIENIGNYLVIHSPASVAGQYQILSVSSDHKSATISGTLSSFTSGIYEVLNISTFRSGLQNGFFTFELSADGYVGVPYNLVQGMYEFEYYSYLSIPIEADRLYGYIGSDLNGQNLVNGTIDEFQTISGMLTDTRIGETAGINQETITKDFNSLKALKPTINTLLLLHFDTFPFINDASIYITSVKKFIQSSNSVNDNFSKSIALTDTPVIVDNTGILNSKKEGSIEFWVSPLFDTGNDPNFRFYFDASSMVSEQVISINSSTVKVVGRVSQVLSIKLKVGNQNIDYFAGGTIDLDNQTLRLHRALPSHQTPVVVNYIPTGTNGDRISIYKDNVGYVNFDVRASGVDYQIRSPVFWVKNTWHRLKALYRFNSGLGSDEIKFFIDGYERGNILFGNGLLFGQHQVFGSSFIGQNTIQASVVFKDTINELFIGSDFTGANGAFALIDNLRISDIARPLFLPFGESIDVNYSSNTSVVFPVAEDLFTTLLLDFDTLVMKNTSFATLKNKKTGLSDFTVNIFDEFDIVKDSAKVKQVLETLLNILKPANSRILINYE